MHLKKNRENKKKGRIDAVRHFHTHQRAHGGHATERHKKPEKCVSFDYVSRLIILTTSLPWNTQCPYAEPNSATFVVNNISMRFTSTDSIKASFPKQNKNKKEEKIHHPRLQMGKKEWSTAPTRGTDGLGFMSTTKRRFNYINYPAVDD